MAPPSVGIGCNEIDVIDTKDIKLPNYTWQEVSKHNTKQSCWVIVEQYVYDITKWLYIHPGGSDMLLLASGRDITNMMYSYHPFTTKPMSILPQFRIGTCALEHREHPTYTPDNSGFYKEMRLKVKEYFVRNNLSPKDPVPGIWRLILMLSMSIFTFSIMFNIVRNTTLPFRMLAGVIFGICQSLPMLHAMHDASHAALSYQPFIWKLIGALSLDWLNGGSLNSWHHQHIVGHHLHTNILGADPDLPVKTSGDFRRITHTQLWSSLYRFQWIYLPLLYAMLAFKVRIQDITGTLIDQTSGNVRVRNISFAMVLHQIIAKMFFVCWRIILPITVFKVAVLEVALISCIAEFTTGIWLAYNFQVSHITPIAESEINTQFMNVFVVNADRHNDKSLVCFDSYLAD